VSDQELIDLVRARLESAAVDVSDQQLASLSAYLQVLARWNRRINLTALPVDPPSPSSIDRLLIEPALGARFVRSSDRLAIDIGSGGGSPALPIRILAPALQMTLVESRGRKAAFLREAARHLGLDEVIVENTRLEMMAESAAHRGRYELVSMRAVRADEALWTAVNALTKSNARMLWFRSGDDAPLKVPGWRLVADESLVGGEGNRLIVLDRGRLVRQLLVN
jgi:16S rRNA (guanine527-N7)-methyltransferase